MLRLMEAVCCYSDGRSLVLAAGVTPGATSSNFLDHLVVLMGNGV